MDESCTFERFLLLGHKGMVNCVDSHGKYLVSGSEDKTVRIWDLDTLKPIKCLVGSVNDGISTVSFHPQFASNQIVCAACNCDLFGFRVDLSQSSILERGTGELIFYAEDDVSAVNFQGAAGKAVAVSDDSGLVSILTLTVPSIEPSVDEGGVESCPVGGLVGHVTSKLTRFHTNIVTGCCFGGYSTTQHQLVSCSVDCKLCLWNTKTGRALHSTDMNECGTLGVEMESLDSATALMTLTAGPIAPSPSASPLINPPFIYAVISVCGGSCIAAAVGDGSLRIFSAFDLTLVGSVTEAHGSMVTCLCEVSDIMSPPFENSTTNGATSSTDSYIVSAGTDGYIKCWKLTRLQYPSPVSAATSSIHSSAKSKKSSKSKKKNEKSTHAPTLSGATGSSGSALMTYVIVKLHWSIWHGEKINQICCRRRTVVEARSKKTQTGPETIFANMTLESSSVVESQQDSPAPSVAPGTINPSYPRTHTFFVADVTSTITVYTRTG